MLLHFHNFLWIPNVHILQDLDLGLFNDSSLLFFLTRLIPLSHLTFKDLIAGEQDEEEEDIEAIILFLAFACLL